MSSAGCIKQWILAAVVQPQNLIGDFFKKIAVGVSFGPDEHVRFQFSCFDIGYAN
jgi:hypothetical protein